MIILALDTALEDISVGLLLPDGRILERSFRHERDALRRLTPLIRDVLREAGLRPQSLEVVACTRGPGSFTGIRVGVAAARALADGCGARMSGVSTLRALCMAGDAGEGEMRLALIRCRPGEVYAGLYGQQSGRVWEPVRPDTALPVPALGELLAASGVKGCVEAVGPAVELCAGALSSSDAGGVAVKLRTDITRVRIADVLEASLQDARSGRLLDPMELIPEYLRPSQAEIRASGKTD
ncbi:MAG: tRNA threonylcarbamoyladenosine biosynthesis protein TsaB [Armatimonadota bacterium]|nr:MAG: tRNA threonylcarbamoyladenosine biosynthesis protein TsaB [Armatimonadota bacterium]